MTAPSEVAAPAARGLFAKTAVTLDMIKVAHTVFALPFALVSLFVAAGGWPGARTLGLAILAVVAARAAAMAFNRLVDHAIDAKNPRTSGRALPAGKLTRGFAAGFVVACAVCFVLAARALNPLCLWLSPVALAVVLGYSLAKRFTSLCHAWLGVALAIAPLGAWVAVKGVIDVSAWTPIVLAVAVATWVAGFDVIYSCQDAQFDRNEGLFSLPARLGPERALRLARVFHAATIVALALAGWRCRFGWIWAGAVAAVGLLLVVQHRIADPADPKRLELAFFRVNAFIGPLLLVAALAELFVR